MKCLDCREVLAVGVCYPPCSLNFKSFGKKLKSDDNT